MLIRHGETEYNAAQRIQGHRDISLSTAGRGQARRLATRLALAWEPRPGLTSSALPIPCPDAIFASDLSRASETAEILRADVPALARCPYLTTPLLRERCYGDWEGLTTGELRARRMTQGEDCPPRGETWSAVWERMNDALAWIWRQQAIATIDTPTAGPDDAKPVHTALVVGHGGSLRAFFCRALQTSPETAHAFRLGNTSISAVAFRGSSPIDATGQILLVNDTAHLQER